MSRMLCTLFAAALTLGGMTSLAPASDYCAPPCRYEPPCCRYEWVTRYETRRVRYTACETCYDHCGRPYQVEVVRCRTVEVPVRCKVAVPCY